MRCRGVPEVAFVTENTRDYSIWECILSYSWSLIYADVSINGNTLERETNGYMDAKDFL